MVPDGWSADATRNTIIPADGWALHPKDHVDHGVWLLLGWLPRGGRQSASFPGGREVDARPTRMIVAGAPRDGETSGAVFFRGDFDVGEVAVSVTAVAHDATAKASVQAVLEHLHFDPSARPSGFPSPARRGLDLARGWAAAHGRPTDGIVLTGPVPGTALFGYTVFFDKGLQPLQIDPARGKVTATAL
jgi:hypothetical protein